MCAGRGACNACVQCACGGGVCGAVCVVYSARACVQWVCVCVIVQCVCVCVTRVATRVAVGGSVRVGGACSV